MKTLINKGTSIKKDETSTINYFDLFISVVQKQPQEGFTIDEIRKRLRIVSALESKLMLESSDMEDADFDLLLACWKQMRWGIPSMDIVAADDYLDSLK